MEIEDYVCILSHHGMTTIRSRCPTLKTAISDIEVDSEPLSGATLKILPGRSKPVEFGVMHRILYKVRWGW
jgi:valyl-tRNA synthetase